MREEVERRDMPLKSHESTVCLSGTGRAGICFVHVNNLCYMVSKNGILYKQSVCCFNHTLTLFIPEDAGEL